MNKDVVIFTLCLSTCFFHLLAPTSLRAETVVQISNDGQKLTSYLENDEEIPTFVEGELSLPAARDRETVTALAFFDLNRDRYKMVSPAEELQPYRIDRDRLGMTHIRFRQFHESVRVWGADMSVHFDENNVLTTVTGTYIPGLNINTVPDLDSDRAVEIAVRDISPAASQPSLKESELVVFPWEGDTYLCWRLILARTAPYDRREYFIDAHDGRVVYSYSRLISVNDVGSGIGSMGLLRNTIETNYSGTLYEMIDSTRQADNDVRGYGGAMPDGSVIKTYIAGAGLPGQVAADGDNYWDSLHQAAAVDAQVYSGLMYDWWLREFGRNSYDNNGSSLINIVDFTGAGENIAFWDGERVVFGVPSAERRSLVACPEVMAHEWAHAVTEYTSELVYFKEPGALNESFSDMMGSAFEWAHDSLDTPDWALGENSFIADSASRHMTDPHLYQDPDYFGLDDPYWRVTEGCHPSALNDYCGIHSNSGVGNKWFQLLSDGGIHHDVTVTGIGVANAAKVAYRANAFYWTASTDFKNAALGTVSAANDLDPGGQWAAQAQNAWLAVGVTLPQPQLYFSYPDGIPGIMPRNEPDSFDIAVTGLYGGTLVPGSGQLHLSLNDEPYQSRPLTEIQTGYFRAYLPPLECDSVLELYLSFQESASGEIFTTDTLEPFTIYPTSETRAIFEDDFEMDRGWTVSGDADNGAWVRGLPYGGGYRTDPVKDFDGSGRCYLTGVGGGDNDVDNGTTVLTSPVFDASGGAEIAYARWYANCYSHAPYSDVMRVYLSNDGGGAWTQVEEIGPVNQASGGWVSHRFAVSDYLTPTDDMQLRFEVSDLGDGSVVEAAVDAVEIRYHRCRRYICGDVDNSGGEPDIADISAVISFLYLGGSTPVFPAAANVNGSLDGTVDITDVTYLIRFLYMSGPQLVCE